MTDARIVLVKPGDVLMLGNVSIPEDEEALAKFGQTLRDFREAVGLTHEILVFEDDIDLGVKPVPETHHEVHLQRDWSSTEKALAGLTEAVARHGEAMSRVGRFT